YKKYFEKDAALTRRFQVVKVDEPDEKKAILMMRGVASMFEKHHKVQILDEALEASVRLSHRYIPARQLPDKSVSLIDTAAARVAVSQHAVPAMVDDCRRRIQALETELEIIDRESAVGMEHAERRVGILDVLAHEKEDLAKLEDAWNKEKTLVDRILDVRGKLRAGSGKAIDDPAAAKSDGKPVAPAGAASQTISEEDRLKLLEELKGLQSQLTEMQGENPLILPSVDSQAVAAVVADWTGIPVGKMVKNEIEAVLKLADALEKRVIGQRHGLETIAKRIQTSRAGLDNPSRPIGVFMLCGPSGVGKTETALTLAETLYGGEQNLITINMSEFQEAHTVSTLKGSPPGYVGYGEGGILTEAVRRKPYSVVLLDEVEKAHSDVHEIFFQVFDKGIMEDGEGREIDFKNTIILLTSNVGSDLIMNMCKDPELKPNVEGLQKSLREPLLKVFPAALLGRLVVIPYYPISDEMLTAIIKLQLSKIQKRLLATHKAPLTYDDSVVKLVASRCTETESGARAVDAILTHTVLPTLSRSFLERMMRGEPVRKVHVGVDGSEFVYKVE
ncbi:MAG: AAA family ATPase, partial [Planctomycetota bacterium]|nr:AAA family ATPase [Planctomycetota bacterium]